MPSLNSIFKHRELKDVSLEIRQDKSQKEIFDELNNLINNDDLPKEVKDELKDICKKTNPNKKKKYVKVAFNDGTENEFEVESVKKEKEVIKNRITEQIREIRTKRKTMAPAVKQINGVGYNLYGGVFDKPGTIKDMFFKVAMAGMQQERKPGKRGNYVGVELEFFSEFQHEEIKRRLIDAKLHKHCRVMTDVSIRVDDRERETGAEICVIAEENNITEVMTNICEFLINLGAKINESCGLHVHLDCRNRTKEVLYYNLVMMQDLMFKLVEPHRATNKFCWKVKSPHWGDQEAMGGDGNWHHAAISHTSYRKHQTVEVRMHHATLDAHSIKNWIKFLVSIAQFAEQAKPKEIETSLDKEVKQYIKERVAQ